MTDEKVKVEEVEETVVEIKDTPEVKEEPVKEEVKEETKEKKSFFKKKDEEKEKLLLQNKELADKVLRLNAEMQNMRRRMEEEKANSLKYEGEDLIKKLLPVVDTFERAISMDDANLQDDVSKFLSGFKMIYGNLSSTLNAYDIKVIDALHQPFDHNTMEAVMTEEVEGIEPGMVIDVLQKGYTYKGKVIRYAMVKVSK